VIIPSFRAIAQLPEVPFKHIRRFDAHLKTRDEQYTALLIRACTTEVKRAWTEVQGENTIFQVPMFPCVFFLLGL
jgi:hypothetical protein